jgi:EAL domain-containing protein (putative c-di-GMP-specific phosphodiesterase class I)
MGEQQRLNSAAVDEQVPTIRESIGSSFFSLKSFTRIADGEKVEENKSSVIHVPPTLSGKCDHCLARGPLEFTFTFAFQPIVDVCSETVYSYEALVRGTNGESAGWVLDHVRDENRYRFDQDCRVAAIALAARLGMQTNLNINFMPNAVYRPENCIRTTFAAAAKYSFPIERIVFEVVENDPLADSSRLVDIMREYQRFGFLTAIDDFGAGYRDLELLAQFRPDVLKIDMALVRDIGQRKPLQAIVHGIVLTCRELGVRVLGEGVETLAEYAWLRDAGIDLFQGYLFGRPGFESLPEPDFAQIRAFDHERGAAAIGGSR